MQKIQINESLYLKIRDFVNKRMGLYFSDNRKVDFIRGISNAAETFGYKDVTTCIEQLLSINWTPKQIQTLASYLTVGETFFYRHKEQIDYIFNSFIQNKYLSKNIRIWSAACCTGEEPYTIALLIKEKIPDYKNWNISILGTDINPVFLKKAKSGVYTEHSFRSMPVNLRNKYFKKIAKNRFKIDDSVMEMVNFKYLNLASQTYPSQKNSTNNLDIILCRNVFIYFNQEAINKVISNFKNCLNNEGILFVSPAETFMVPHTLMGRSPFTNPIFFTTKPIIKTNKSIQEICRFIDKKKLKTNKINIKNNNKPLPLTPKVKSHKKPAEKKLTEDTKHINSLNKLFYDCKYEELIKQFEALDISNFSLKSKKTFLSLIGKTYANLGNLNESLKICERLISIDKLDIDSYFLHASILIEMEKTDKAILELNKILYLDNSHIMTHFMLGNLLLTKNNINKANKHMQKALNLLEKQRPDKILEESEGLTVKRIIDIIKTLLKSQGIEV